MNKLLLAQSQASKLETQFFVSLREISKFFDVILFFFELGFQLLSQLFVLLLQRGDAIEG
jgi:hypothetical protein